MGSPHQATHPSSSTGASSIQTLLFTCMQGPPGVHPSRRPTPSSSTGSSEHRHVRSWKDMTTAATPTTPDSAVNPSDHGPVVQDTSTSKGERAVPSQQMSKPAYTAAADMLGRGGKSFKGPPPGFDAQGVTDPQPAAVQTAVEPLRKAWGGLQAKSDSWQPTAVASSGASDPTAVGSSPQLQLQSLPAKPMPASRPQRYRPDEAEERFAAEQNEGGQEAKRSRTGQSPHHPHTLTPSPPNSAEEDELQVSVLSSWV